MKNNYDLILNFETNDGEPLSNTMLQSILDHAGIMARTLAHHDITVKKAIVSQAMDSRIPPRL